MNIFKLKNVRTGRVFYIDQSVATIGRDTSSDVVLALGYPSRHHAKISVQENGFVLEDLKSTNGTFVNDHRIDGPTIVKAGDEIKFSTETYCLLDVGVHDKTIISGKLSSKSINNTGKKVPPAPNDTIVRPIIKNKILR
jgi:hypothetical protein